MSRKAIADAAAKARPTTSGDPTEADRKRYAHLLGHADDKKPAEVEELAALIQKVGGDPHGDAAAVGDCQRHCQCFEEGKAARALIPKAQRAIEDHDAETRLMIRQLEERRREERQKLQDELNRVNNLWALAKQAAQELHDLKTRTHPLLAHVPELDPRS